MQRMFGEDKTTNWLAIFLDYQQRMLKYFKLSRVSGGNELDKGRMITILGQGTRTQ